MEEPAAEEEETTSLESSSAPVQVSVTAAEAFIHHQVQVAEAKHQIATLSTAVISSPQDEVVILSLSVNRIDMETLKLRFKLL